MVICLEDRQREFFDFKKFIFFSIISISFQTSEKPNENCRTRQVGQKVKHNDIINSKLINFITRKLLNINNVVVLRKKP